MHKFTVLVVEDEKNICDFISKVLTSHDYRVSCASTGKEALSLASSLCPDIILLDLGLPDLDGIEVIQKIRSWSGNPIIVISARSLEDDKVQALDAGADDYLTKPFGTSELLARIRTSLRHSNKISSNGLPQHPFRAKGLEIDFFKRNITVNGQAIHLTPIEYKIVAFLAQNSGKVMTYSAVMNNVWGPYAEFLAASFLAFSSSAAFFFSSSASFCCCSSCSFCAFRSGKHGKYPAQTGE